MVVFDVTERTSFENLEVWINEIKEKDSHSNYQIVILGNKSDRDDQRKITFEEASNYSESKGYQYFEVSAKTNSNIDSAFQELSFLCYKQLSFLYFLFFYFLFFIFYFLLFYFYYPIFRFYDDSISSVTTPEETGGNKVIITNPPPNQGDNGKEKKCLGCI